MGRILLKNKNKSQPEANIEDMESISQFFPPIAPSSRIISLHGEINEHMMAHIITQMLHYANTGEDPIHLVVSTYGGAVDEMFSLYDLIKFIPCPVHTVALGKVMSAGVLLLASGEKGKRIIGKSARIMIHPISGGMYGNIFEIENEKKEQDRLQKLMTKNLLEETKFSAKQLNEIMQSGKDHYLTPEEALKFGIVDKIIGNK